MFYIFFSHELFFSKVSDERILHGLAWGYIFVWRGLVFVTTKCLLIKSHWCVVVNSYSLTEAIALWRSSFILEAWFQLWTLDPRSQPDFRCGCDIFPQFWYHHGSSAHSSKWHFLLCFRLLGISLYIWGSSTLLLKEW